MKVLVTGSRAPASMDMIRSLIAQGYEVYSADSIPFPLGRFVKGLKKHFTLPKPNDAPANFLKTIKHLVIEYQIKLLIPTCEEIFFISQAHEELSKYTRLFCEPFERLILLHNKYTFNQRVLEYGLEAPVSWLLTTNEDKQKLPTNTLLVLKPIFSRFGSHLKIKPTRQIIDELPLIHPYVAQQFITGKEYCAYAIAHRGKVLLASCYHSKYTAGLAAGIYFEPVEIASITQFITIFCQKYEFSGQIAFDFIVDGNRTVVLECNPRATSGFHFIAEQINWADILKGQQQSYQVAKQSLMLGLGMQLYGLKYFRRNPKSFIVDYLSAQDILKNKAYPWLGVKSLFTFANGLVRMIQVKKSFHNALTSDIEFNGESK